MTAAAASAAPAVPASYDLEVPLSRSEIWQRQRDYFVSQGVAAFRSGVVPHYVTNHPQWARVAADLTVTFIRDALAHDPRASADAPFYVVDAGAGSGRFAFGLVQELGEALARCELEALRVVVVLADLSPATRAFWAAHPQLAPLFAAGRMDIAAFDALDVGALALERSGVTLARGQVTNPLVVVTNYLFDSLPTDVFSYERDGLCEHVARIEGEAVCYRKRPVVLPYYGDERLDALVEAYRLRLPLGTPFSIPIAGLTMIDRLAALADGRLMLLAADKGYVDLSELLAGNASGFTSQGSDSMMVSFDAIARYTTARGGTALLPRHAQGGLATCAYVFGAAPGEVRRVFNESVERFGPADYLAIRRGMKRGLKGWSLDELIGWWRLTAWDPSFPMYAGDALLDAVAEAPADVRHEAFRGAMMAWQRHFALHPDDDASFQIGLLLAELGAYREAITLFEHARNVFGPTAPTLYNQAFCHVRLGAGARAEELLLQALALDPAHESARVMLARLLNAAD